MRRAMLAPAASSLSPLQPVCAEGARAWEDTQDWCLYFVPSLKESRAWEGSLCLQASLWCQMKVLWKEAQLHLRALQQEKLLKQIICGAGQQNLAEGQLCCSLNSRVKIRTTCFFSLHWVAAALLLHHSPSLFSLQFLNPVSEHPLHPVELKKPIN